MKFYYSDNLGGIIPWGFTYKKQHYTWNENDMVYNRDDCDDCFYFFDSIPSDAILD